MGWSRYTLGNKSYDINDFTTGKSRGVKIWNRKCLNSFSFVFVLICFLLTDHPVFVHARKLHSDQRKQKMGWGLNLLPAAPSWSGLYHKFRRGRISEGESEERHHTVCVAGTALQLCFSTVAVGQWPGCLLWELGQWGSRWTVWHVCSHGDRRRA